MGNNYKEDLEKVYENSPAIWTSTTPPKKLVELIKGGIIKPCKVLDVGCGEGFYSIYLAKQGFDVIGIDISENAIKHAKNNAKREGVNVRFESMDLFDISKLNERFDFIFEWAILHHIEPKKRKDYVKEIFNKLNNGGKYLSVCFNERNPGFAQPGKKVRTIPASSRALQGTKLYFSSLDEMRTLFHPYFKIIESKIIEISIGKSNLMNYLFMEK